VQKQEFSVTCFICDTHKKAKHVHKKQTHLLLRENVTQGYDRKDADEKYIVGRVKGLDAKKN
jgi:hypothetical protein